MNAYLFAGQGAQTAGMGKNLYLQNPKAARIFDQANEILGFNLTQIMFEGTDEDLKPTNITQPAIFVYAIALIASLEHNFNPQMAAGHSLGEFSALCACQAIAFEHALPLVQLRANAMQQACTLQPSAMAAIIGAPSNQIVEEVCKSIENEIVVPANYNCPGQLVISGTSAGIEQAIQILQQKGVKMAIKLPVAGAFHSPIMQPAQNILEKAILNTPFTKPQCPVFQNINATPSLNPEEIQKNLIYQLTAPVLWEQTLVNMLNTNPQAQFFEISPKPIFNPMLKKIDRSKTVNAL